MNWFKSMWLTSEERQILRDAKKEKNKTIEVIPTKESVVTKEIIEEPRCYKKLSYSNKNITVVFNDGDYLSCANVNQDVFLKVKDALTKKEIEKLLLGEDEEEIEEFDDTPEEKQLVKDNLDILRDHEDFEVKGEIVFMKGVNLELPSVITFSFIEILEKMEDLNARAGRFGGVEIDSDNYLELQEQYNALKMFWLKLAVNPLEQSRKDLLTFVKRNDVRITNNGNLVLYRRIVSVSQEDKELTTFVSQSYYDRKKQKKSQTHPRNYNVIRMDGTLMIMKNTDKVDRNPEILGNLEEMYKNLDKLEGNSFVSYHSGKNGKMPIKIGSIYKIPDDEINLNNGLCAAGGIHAAAVNYDYGSFGDTPVVVLVNPSKAITVPTGDWQKLRTIEMFVACVNDKPHGTHFDEGALSAFDEEYHDLSLQELEEVVSTKSFEKVTIEKIKPTINLVDINKIKEMLSERIKEVI